MSRESARASKGELLHMKGNTVGLVGLFEEHMIQEIRRALPDEFELCEITSKDQTALLAEINYMITRLMVIDRQVIEAASQLELIQRWGVGYDKVDVDAATERGIPVMIAAGVNSVSVAEHTVLLMLAVLRNLSLADRLVRDGFWNCPQVTAGAMTLQGKTVGLLGFGHIARSVAEKVRAFGAEVNYYDVVRCGAQIEEQYGVSYVSFDQLISGSDIISLHLPLIPQTTLLVDANVIGRMRPNAVLINTSRGKIVDEQALAEALSQGRLRGAGLDTLFDEPPSPHNRLLQLDNVICTPHIGGTTQDNDYYCAQHCMKNILAVRERLRLNREDLVNPQFVQGRRGFDRSDNGSITAAG